MLCEEADERHRPASSYQQVVVSQNQRGVGFRTSRSSDRVYPLNVMLHPATWAAIEGSDDDDEIPGLVGLEDSDNHNNM